MTEEKLDAKKDVKIEEMFTAGAHFGYSRSRRHPSIKNFIYGAKGNVELFDLSKTVDLVGVVEEFATSLAKEGKKVLFVGSKHEARAVLKSAAEKLDMPYVINRWIGGSLTNFSEIKKRLARLAELSKKKEKGELGMYTKKERLMFDKEIERLERNYGGIRDLTEIPTVMFLVDSKKESNALNEAKVMGLKTVSISNSDCDVNIIDYPMVANDGARASIKLLLNKFVEAYEAGKGKKAPVDTAKPASKIVASK